MYGLKRIEFDGREVKAIEFYPETSDREIRKALEEFRLLPKATITHTTSESAIQHFDLGEMPYPGISETLPNS